MRNDRAADALVASKRTGDENDRFGIRFPTRRESRGDTQPEPNGGLVRRPDMHIHTKPRLGLVAVRDRECRSSVTRSLRRVGWMVDEYASGFHVVQALSGLILGIPVRPKPDLVIIDAISPGCSAVTVAAGFRDLGLEIPIMLIAPRAAPDLGAELHTHSAALVEPAAASTALVAIAKLLPRHRVTIIDARAAENGRHHAE